jgi:hypothetical protein
MPLCIQTYFWQSVIHKPITIAARSKAWTVFARSNIGTVGSNLTWGMDVRVRLFCVQVAALRRADPPVQGVLPTV